MSQLRIAKIAGARRVVAERIATAGCKFSEETARDVVDDLLKLGWTFPGWQVDDDVPQPATSSPGHRARVLAEARAQLAAAKKTRAAKPEHNQQQGEAK